MSDFNNCILPDLTTINFTLTLNTAYIVGDDLTSNMTKHAHRKVKK